MAVKARIIGAGSVHLADCLFAYPLNEGTSFVLRSEEGTRIYRVSTVVHFPTEVDGGNEPMVAYGVDEVSQAKWWKNKQWWGELLMDLLPKK
ncbi:hypothetical protein [Sphingomonas desiccabilis]|uniref:Uncharacterized protein n=1 Tax=Sphingomonas desiccabilis TaxID=429134 RepID=A0A4Q2IWJ4_9SPHN|nr:hypothetical protein [Sphingomonas desiccabilis]MBB3910121.1 hypothetical protein [Sphingomonas desiccabilis]RXZ34806.1 hypothetical protein EO081_03875 [Sphingomonas desiccabilis]